MKILVFILLLIMAVVFIYLKTISPTGDVFVGEVTVEELYDEPPLNFYFILVVAGVILLALWYYFNTIKKEFTGRAN